MAVFLFKCYNVLVIKKNLDKMLLIIEIPLSNRQAF